MKVLIITRLNKTPGEKEDEKAAARHISSLGAANVTITRDEELDWSVLRRVEGSYEAAYQWAAREYDRIVVIEAPNGMMAKGQTCIVEAALACGTPVAVWRKDRGYVVRRVVLEPDGCWKSGYARAVI